MVAVSIVTFDSRISLRHYLNFSSNYKYCRQHNFTAASSLSQTVPVRLSINIKCDNQCSCNCLTLRTLTFCTTTSVDTTVGLPTEKSKVHQFQICCARTKYLSEIHRGRTIIVCAAKLFFANSPLT